jgi:DNA polymerase epsilon subunit 2
VSFSSPTVLLPAPPLPEALVAPLRATLGNRAHFPSNPARLRLHAREVVVFRSDVAARLRAAALLPPNSGSSGNNDGNNNASASTGASATFEHAALTLLQQAHLCPLPLDAAPVSWDVDGGLRLYPLPHALVLAGGGRGGGRGAARGCDASFEGVECFDPGSFSKCGSFRGYSPADGSVESCCAMPEGEEW